MDGKPEVAAIADAVLAIRRRSARRTLARAAERQGASGGMPSVPDAVVLLLDLVEETTTRPADGTSPGSGPTVTEAAAALGVDQPRASRLAAQALDAGLLRREADQTDGRRSLLHLTPEGAQLLGVVHAFRRGVVAEATAGWPDQDRAELARLLTRFVADFAAVTDPSGRAS